MPFTPRGIFYPASGDHTRLWEHLQQLAESVNADNVALADQAGLLTTAGVVKWGVAYNPTAHILRQHATSVVGTPNGNGDLLMVDLGDLGFAGVGATPLSPGDNTSGLASCAVGIFENDRLFARCRATNGTPIVGQTVRVDMIVMGWVPR